MRSKGEGSQLNPRALYDDGIWGTARLGSCIWSALENEWERRWVSSLSPCSKLFLAFGQISFCPSKALQFAVWSLQIPGGAINFAEGSYSSTSHFCPKRPLRASRIDTGFSAVYSSPPHKIILWFTRVWPSTKRVLALVYRNAEARYTPRHRRRRQIWRLTGYVDSSPDPGADLHRPTFCDSDMARQEGGLGRLVHCVCWCMSCALRADW